NGATAGRGSSKKSANLRAGGYVDYRHRTGRAAKAVAHYDMLPVGTQRGILAKIRNWNRIGRPCQAGWRKVDHPYMPSKVRYEGLGLVFRNRAATTDGAGRGEGH